MRVPPASLDGWPCVRPARELRGSAWLQLEYGAQAPPLRRQAVGAEKFLSNSGSRVSDYNFSRRRVVQGLAAAALPLGMFGCAEKKTNALVVGGLPVTCNLTLPVACTAKAAANKAAAAGAPKYEYEYNKYNGWPEIKRSEEHTSELQSLRHLVCRLLLEKK